MTGCDPIYYTFDSLTRNEAPSLVEVGGKALSLIESTQAGFPVPQGFCLTVSFFETWLETIRNTSQRKLFLQNATKQTCDDVKATCLKLALSPSQTQVLNEAWKQTFGDGSDILVAVRSSSPEEDLAGTSFAGGYETTLGVKRKSLQSALLTSFASAFDYRIVQYKTRVGIPIDNAKIAVIVQRQIASDVSGVAFSLNPCNNCLDETVISANFGLGESVVGGSVTPDTYIVSFVTNEIMCKNIADKKHAVWLDDAGGTRHQEENDDPSAQALTDDQILQVAELVSKVEAYREDTPVDIEWAFQGETLFLLQSRPVTAYIPVFEEMKTARGEEKNLYVDVIVMTQGFLKPMSVLGLEIWFKFFQKAKPNLCFAKGRDGLVWDIHGREFLHLSNLMKCSGGRPIVEKSLALSDKSLGRACDTLDLDEYTPSRAVPLWWDFLWTSLTQFMRVLPNMIYGLFFGKKALTGYQEYAQELFDDCQNDEYLKELSFNDTVEESMNRINGLFPKLGALVAPCVSQWKIQKLFEGRKEAKEDLITALSMDMEGNPTSEMGHMMVELASYPEIQNTQTSQDFLNNLNDKAYSDKFMNAYTDYITRFGWRGIKEIDAATPRSYERHGELFDQLKQIDIEHNVITTVMERRQEAYDKLLDVAAEMGKRDKFIHHAKVIQKMGGYRESPKYIYVACTAMLRRRALSNSVNDLSKRETGTCRSNILLDD